MAKLQPGTYRLTQDVENWKVDRRYKKDWRKLPTFPKGARFEVFQYAETSGSLTRENMQMIPCEGEEWTPDAGDKEHGLEDWNLLYKVVKAHLEPITDEDEETVDDEELEPGLYRLTQDVKNPEPDRRYKYDWRYRATIPAGAVFEVTTRTVSFDYDGGTVSQDCSYMRSSKRGKRWARVYSHHEIQPSASLWQAMEPHLVPYQTKSTMKERVEMVLEWIEPHDDVSFTHREVVAMLKAIKDGKNLGALAPEGLG